MFNHFFGKIYAICLLTQILSGTKLLQNSEIGKFFPILPPFCQVHVAKLRKTCFKTYFFIKIFGRFGKKQYFCTVFFMVLDLRLSKDWVVGMTILLFFVYACGLCPRIKRPVVPSRTPYPRRYGRIMQPMCKKNGIESQLSAVFFAHVRFLLYLCSQNGKSLR